MKRRRIRRNSDDEQKYAMHKRGNKIRRHKNDVPTYIHVTIIDRRIRYFFKEASQLHPRAMMLCDFDRQWVRASGAADPEVRT